LLEAERLEAERLEAEPLELALPRLRAPLVPVWVQAPARVETTLRLAFVPPPSSIRA